MSEYSMKMDEEKKPKSRILLPEGWRQFKIVGCEETTSKSGNKMFVITAEDLETKWSDTWYAVAEPKKRWFLKSILEAVECPIKDGVYEWNIKDVIDKFVMGLVVHEPNEYINREGETIKTTQHKVQDISKVEKDDQKVAWDE